jgi:hypothetical protein
VAPKEKENIMAKTVQILGRSYLPGPGFNSSGSPKQGKVQVWGIVTISSYTASGEPMTAADLGMTTIDEVTFNVDKANNADIGAVESTAVYQYTNKLVHVYSAAATAAATSGIDVLRFHAVGDSGNDVESLS